MTPAGTLVENDAVIDEVVKIIGEAINSAANRELVAASEMIDFLLDIRLLLTSTTKEQ